LQEYKSLFKTPFDLVFFTFPHSGVPNSDPYSIRSNGDLLRQFLSSVHHVLAPNGQVQMTLKNGDVYDKWNFQGIAEEVTRLQYEGNKIMRKDLFPGYHHRLTKGMQGTMKEVKDKMGATVHRFSQMQSSNQSSMDSPPMFSSLDVFVLGPESEDDPSRKKRKRSENSWLHPSDEWVKGKILQFCSCTVA